MLRSSLITAGVGLLCSSALAQNVRTPVPINVPIKDGGTLDWATGTWTRNGGAFANAPGANVIFENTCNFSGGAFYSPNAECWDQYEEGRLPTLDPADPFTATIAGNGDASQVCACYFLCGFQFGYCSNENPNGGGRVNLQIGLLEGANVSGIGGDCMNAGGALATPSPPSGAPANLGLPPANFGGPNDLFVDISGLPGTSTPLGNAGCWLITIDLSNNANGGFKFCGDGGDGMFSGDASDNFNWLFGQRGTSEFGATPTGPFLAGDFQVAGGTGAFGIPQGTLLGVPCGTGLGIGDFQWINIDGQPVGSTSLAACQDGGGALPAGSNCYFFGGWPANPVADAYLVMWASTVCETGAGGAGDITAYCTAKASSSGCLASMGGSTNGPIVSGANNWSVVMSDAQGQRPGIFFGSNTSAAALAFQGGFLCVQPPTKRSVILFTGGTANTCNGTFSLQINNGASFPPPLAGSGFDAGPGGTSFMQGWYRDPALMDGFDTALSDGLQIDWM